MYTLLTVMLSRAPNAARYVQLQLIAWINVIIELFSVKNDCSFHFLVYFELTANVKLNKPTTISNSNSYFLHSFRCSNL